ncbi:phospho-2-dehydro-3-deoxyheptonate aldolase [Streptomyces sp. AC1-42W]|uniref:3-deoxy-7-phosphoheptulonate synthase n=2 Tax=Streptomyces TaxID=1883 RepID=UPI000DAB5466|nr:3-deoxy-7-phosphoheptulonate synthase [Streptomyces sp. AC1-42W]PZT74829.1 phospho-2-dehydro-3-deoxyheptonate aldolase [Streptomyces sp. AC1-42T]PZT82186.1 phospho-2-dehydro-3-deoxyheptonate aldolase [Streptomyces sp. AC1-42W]
MLPAGQQPDWPDENELNNARARLVRAPGLVRAQDVSRLRWQLARAARGELHVIQAGDCAEDPAECSPGHVARKTALLDVLAGVLKERTLKPVLRVGRLAGQFGKPRSSPFETVDGVQLPVYRGHMVNHPEPDPALRRPDPRRLVAGYEAAGATMRLLGWHGEHGPDEAEAPVWTSHEALLLDYEGELLRTQDDGSVLLTSTHWPWIGERTRQLDGAHVALLASAVNPVAVKVGPGIDPAELTALCERLDPRREPGRLTLISRMGRGTAAERLPGLVRAVHAAGHPALWLCDPMHGNTVSAPGGVKTRYVSTIIGEVEEFQQSVAGNGGTAAGLHLETTPDQVHECVSNEIHLVELGEKYTSFCDPRLNPEQAREVVSAWRG